MVDIKKLVERDPIVKRGFSYRRRMSGCLIGALAVVVVGVPLFPPGYLWAALILGLVVGIIGIFYYIKFGKWEKANAEHLKRLGFTIDAK